MIWWICLAGGLGAVARAGVDSFVARRWEPWRATLAVNLLGSFVLGVASVALTGGWLVVVGAGLPIARHRKVTICARLHMPVGMKWVGAGFCGAFTTFSSACWQAARELGRERARFAVAYSAVTVAGCILAAWLGTTVG